MTGLPSLAVVLDDVLLPPNAVLLLVFVEKNELCRREASSIEIVHPFVAISVITPSEYNRTPPARRRPSWPAWSPGWQAAAIAQTAVGLVQPIGLGIGNDIFRNRCRPVSVAQIGQFLRGEFGILASSVMDIALAHLSRPFAHEEANCDSGLNAKHVVRGAGDLGVAAHVGTQVKDVYVVNSSAPPSAGSRRPGAYPDRRGW